MGSHAIKINQSLYLRLSIDQHIFYEVIMMPCLNQVSAGVTNLLLKTCLVWFDLFGFMAYQPL